MEDSPPGSSPDSNSPSRAESFDRDRHVFFLQMMYQLMPSQYQGQEINRLTLAYFAVSGLHILRSVDSLHKEEIISWVLSLQAHPKNEALLNDGQFYGFHGSRSSQFQKIDNGVWTPNGSHLASTYCAVAILKTVGHDLSVTDSETILKSLKNLQQPDGSFMPIHSGAETDLRFVYCAAAISSMLGNWSGMDREMAKEYIINCQSYDGGFGLTPGSESHGGATYCAVASLQLMGYIEDGLLSKRASSCIIDVPLLLDWSLQRQAADGGFQGRPNKPTDTCYAFWVGGVLRILGAYQFIDETALRKFLLTCQSEVLLLLLPVFVSSIHILALKCTGRKFQPPRLRAYTQAHRHYAHRIQRQRCATQDMCWCMHMTHLVSRPFVFNCWALGYFIVPDTYGGYPTCWISS